MSHVPRPDKNGVRWYGHFHPTAGDPARCITQVNGGDSRLSHFRQCHRKAVAGDYCRQHAPATEKFAAWRVDRYARQPEKIEVTELSDKQVRFPDGRREKNGAYYRYFATYAAARDNILNRLRADLAAAERDIGVYRAQIHALESAPNPEE